MMNIHRLDTMCCIARAWVWNDECLGPPCSWFWARPPESPLSTHQNCNLYKLPELPARPSLVPAWPGMIGRTHPFIKH